MRSVWPTTLDTKIDPERCPFIPEVGAGRDTYLLFLPLREAAGQEMDHRQLDERVSLLPTVAL